MDRADQANWEVGHTQYVTSRATQARFEPDKARLVGLGFNWKDPFVIWISQSGCRVMEEKPHFSVLTHLDPVCQPMKTPTKNQKQFASFLLKIRPFLEKWIILIYHSPVRFFLKAGKSQTTVFC